jgi:hypothetical protein
LIPKLLSDFLESPSFDKEGTQGFVLAVIGFRRFEKELATAGVIHGSLHKVDQFWSRYGVFSDSK